MTVFLAFLAYIGIATLLFAFLVVVMHGKEGWKQEEALVAAVFCYVWPISLACLSVVGLFGGVFVVASAIGRALNK